MVQFETVLQGFSINTSEGGTAYCAVTLIRGQKLTLVDVGHLGRRALLMERLAARGIRPEQIERVILTHAHWDHCHNLLDFPNAEVVLHQDEREYVLTPHPQDWATPAWTADILARCKQVTTVRDGDELEPEIRVMATPGHSPGSMTVLLRTDQGIAGIVGDALPSRASTAVMAPRLVFFDEEAGRRSARTIVETCRLIYPGHDRPFRAENGTFTYIQPQSVVFQFVPRDE
ncbi:MAG TPA: MBL fold metallo-hydrolase, partial [Dehalococcoidia bacterium]|nr:MBL fold metallo-hydrolase [Dehalococcoidia bacterium]